MRGMLDPGTTAGVAATADAVITVRGLRMAYGDREVMRGIDLDVRRGEVFALLGPDGAGKTMTVEILEGYRRRTQGRVTVLGADPESAGGAWRARVGVVLQESEPEPAFTVRECLELYAGYYERPRPVDETMSLAGLYDRASTRGCDLSGGLRRRLDLALAVIGDPELIFLDGPTTGLDPAARHSAWDVVRSLRDLGKTIFLATHLMAEAEALADRIAVLAAGRVVAVGTPRTLGGRDAGASRICFSLPPGARASDLPECARLGASMNGERRITVRTTVPMTVLGALAPWAAEHDWRLEDLEVRPPSLEDVYLELTGGAQ